MFDMTQRQTRAVRIQQRKFGSPWIMFAMVVLLLVCGTVKVSAAVHRRISMSKAQALADKLGGQSEFPIVANEFVLKALNRHIGTSEGRETMRRALEQMEALRPLVESKVKNHNAPIELMAIPIVESGYKNNARGGTTLKSTGIWQFIPATARAYGLSVDDAKDERVDIPLATDAALRYLQASKLRFNDWLLGVLAYNIGERAVQKGINVTGSRDVWTLTRNGYGGDLNYVGNVIAAAIIMQNPELVQENAN